MKPETEMARWQQFALHLGFVRGAIMAPDILAILKERGVTDAELMACKKALNKIAEAFYRD